MSTPHTSIRPATASEYPILGRLHASAFSRDAMYNLFWSTVEPSVVLDWVWGARAEASVDKGTDTVLVMQRDDTGETVGVAWYKTYSRVDPPTFVELVVPEGFNLEEYTKKEIPMQKWLRGLTDTYGEFLYVQELAIAPQYQSQGLGKAFMLRLIDIAKTQRKNIALAASSGTPPFYVKLGFVEVAPPMKLANGSVEGTNMMLLELFPREE